MRSSQSVQGIRLLRMKDVAACFLVITVGLQPASSRNHIKGSLQLALHHVLGDDKGTYIET